MAREALALNILEHIREPELTESDARGTAHFPQFNGHCLQREYGVWLVIVSFNARSPSSTMPGVYLGISVSDPFPRKIAATIDLIEIASRALLWVPNADVHR